LRYLVPLEEDKGESSKVSWHFGRAPYFAIVSLDTEVKFEVKPTIGHTDTGSDALNFARTYKVDAVIAKAIGQRALQSLLSIGIKVYETRADTLSEVINEIKNNKLKIYTPAGSLGLAPPSIYGPTYTPPTLQPPAVSTSSGRLRVAVATEGPGGLEDIVSVRFGRCPTFTFLEVENGKIVNVEVKQNPYAMAPQGAGIAVVQFIVSSGANYVVAGAFGPNASYALSQAPVVAITVPPGTRVKDVVNYLR
jgi:predicted Fe-Mo cluster-binding NifX family protein